MAELFERVEVNRESRRVVLSRLIGGSIILHLAVLWLVIYVPTVRDTLNIAALVANTKFVERDYDRTQIQDVQIVQLTEKFRYPDGYFATADQVQLANEASGTRARDPFAPKIISLAGSDRDVDPEASPSPSPSPDASPLPSNAEDVANANREPLTPEEAQKELEKAAEESNVPLPDETQINKKVLKDFAAYANDLKNEGKLDLNKPFEVVIEAELDEKGKLINPRFIKKTGDENLVDLFGRMVAALNDSGFLTYLQPISKDNPGAKVRITVKQGAQEVLALVESEASSPERAESLAKALNNLLFFGAGSRAGKDEEVLMKNTNASPEGKNVVLHFSMPRQTVVDMIKKQLEPGA